MGKKRILIWATIRNSNFFVFDSFRSLRSHLYLFFLCGILPHIILTKVLDISAQFSLTILMQINFKSLTHINLTILMQINCQINVGQKCQIGMGKN